MSAERLSKTVGSARPTKAVLWHFTLACALALALITPSLLWLDESPPPWWDEGWTLLVARHAVEDNFYGRLPVGQPDGPGLAAAFPTTGLVILSFKLLGVGIWQARLPSFLLTIVALSILYALVRRLYNRRVAAGALGILLFTTSHLATNPVFVARQVLAEPMQLCTLLGGYLAFLTSTRRRWAFVLALLLWGVALVAKAQTLPFWLASLLIPLIIALVRHQWRPVAILTGCLLGAWIVMQGLTWLIATTLAGRTAPSDNLSGMAVALALVTAQYARVLSASVLLLAGIPALAGVIWVGWQTLRSIGTIDINDRIELTRLMLVVLAGSWLAWYALLSIGWARYAYPAIFVASPFAAVLVGRWTEGFSLQGTLARIISSLRDWLPLSAIGPFVSLTMLMLLIPLTVSQQYSSFVQRRDASLYETVAFLEANTTPESVVESYESEVLALLRRPYHYPPDRLNLLYIQRGDEAAPTDFHYDALVADPDYLVVGVMGSESNLYTSALRSGEFNELFHYGQYTIYKRNRLRPQVGQ